MKAFVIALVDQSYEPLTRSIEKTESPLELHWLPATTPLTIKDDRKAFPKFRWTWPMLATQDGLCMETGVFKFVYQAKEYSKKIACSLSHMKAWQKCVDLDEPIIIFEADAVVKRKIDIAPDQAFVGMPSNCRVIGLNDPRGATRRASTYHAKQVEYGEGINPVSTVNELGENPVPQGLAGNSAYYITPTGAKNLLQGAEEYGMWPNDAFMCKELFPFLRQAYPYYTTISGTESTTTR
jgi:GR25 family glycosyltransferase involved in LPS biosynthesis